MECGICGMHYDEEFMIPGKGYYGICFDCARNLVRNIIDVIESKDPKAAGHLIAERLAHAKLLSQPMSI